MACCNCWPICAIDTSIKTIKAFINIRINLINLVRIKQKLNLKVKNAQNVTIGRSKFSAAAPRRDAAATADLRRLL